MGEYNGMCYMHDGEEFIEHHGIKGQKWGIRRFQYENGSYTEEGKKRYGRSDAKTQKSNYKRLLEISKDSHDSQNYTTSFRFQARQIFTDDQIKRVAKALSEHRKNTSGLHETDDQLDEDFFKPGGLKETYDQVIDEALGKYGKYNRFTRSGVSRTEMMGVLEDAASDDIASQKNGFNPRTQFGINSTPMEMPFEKNAFEALGDSKLRKQIREAVESSSDKEVARARNLVKDYGKLVDDMNESFDKYEAQYYKEHGPVRVDGSEMYEMLCEAYPEYNKLAEKEHTAKEKIVHVVAQIANSSDSFKNIEMPKNYKNFFDEWQNPKNGEFEYKYASSKAYPILLSLSELSGADDWIRYWIFPFELIQNYNSKGKMAQ